VPVADFSQTQEDVAENLRTNGGTSRYPLDSPEFDRLLANLMARATGPVFLFCGDMMSS
jgi:hypothetical protein